MSVNIEEIKNSIVETLGHGFVENNDFNLRDDVHNGQIYLLINKSNGKLYVGQAACFVGTNNNSWGTIGRWKSHVREAVKNSDDHCVLLNHAIRKYGESGFEVVTLFKGNNDELNDMEVHYIRLLKSMSPNGYNLKTGGDKGKDSDETKQKKKEAKTGLKFSDETKQNISKGQLGNRRNSMVRKHEEDNILPKYICGMRRADILTGFTIRCFPIGIEKKEYHKDEFFSIAKYGSKEKALDEAIKFLNGLKEKYSYIDEEISKIKIEDNKASAVEKREDMIKEKLSSEYIFPILENMKIIGYYVEGITDNFGREYPRRDFTLKTNRWNLDEAEKYVAMLEYINTNNVSMSRFDTTEMDVNSIEKSFFEKYYLPNFVNVLRKKGEIRGFCINGYPDSRYSDGKYKKEFILHDKRSSSAPKSFDDIYEEVIDHLFELNLNNSSNII